VRHADAFVRGYVFHEFDIAPQNTAGGAAMTESLVIVSREQILRRRICGEYLEMPGLRLTCRQAQRLWAIDEQTCVQILESLTQEKFLYRRDDGTYGRLTEGAATFPPPRMLKRSASAPRA
jgi:hypothetical protein